MNGFDRHDQMIFIRKQLILCKLDHPSIVKFYEIKFTIIWLSRKTFTNDHHWISPKWIIEKHPKQRITFKSSFHIRCDITSMAFLHRDLKAFLLILIFIIVFVISLTKSMQMTMTRKFGAPLYMAPEICCGPEIDVFA